MQLHSLGNQGSRMILKNMQCVVQAGLCKSILQLRGWRSQTKGLSIEFSYCIVLEGNGGHVVSQLRNSWAKGGGLSLETAQSIVLTGQVREIAQFWRSKVKLEHYDCKMYNLGRQEWCIARCQEEGLLLEGWDYEMRSSGRLDEAKLPGREVFYILLSVGSMQLMWIVTRPDFDHT